MKKALAVLVLALFAGTAAFAVPAFGLSAGAGGIFTKAFGGGYEATGVTLDLPSLGGGGFVFLDATFAELDINFTYNAGTAPYSSPAYSTDYDFNFSAIGFGLLGKYPFEVGPVAIFPMIGIEYRYALSAEFDGNDADDASDMSRFGIRFGAGVDYHLSPALFLRAEVLYAIRFENKFEKDRVDQMNDAYGPSGYSFSSKMSHGPDIKIGVGYQFF
jgi:opacity protein-like surface antigen